MGEKRNTEEEIASHKKIRTDETEKRMNVLAQFTSENGDTAGPPIELPINLPKEKLQLILNTFLQEDENVPYSFFVSDEEVTTSLESTLDKLTLSEEKIVQILYQPQAVFRVRAVTRCTSSLPGHAKEILHATFSPDGQNLASGSGDTTVRFWDIYTETPLYTCKAHTSWVLVTAWSPDSQKLASACKAGKIAVWSTTGKQIGKTMCGHKQWVTALCWEPLHLTKGGESVRLASAGKDGDVRIWNTQLGTCEKVLSNHTKCVTCLRWSGEGLLYSGSQDRTIKVWRAADGVMCRTLQGHAHWVNTLALSTDYVLRTGASDPQKLMKPLPELTPSSDRISVALERYKKALAVGGQERLVSGSDDFTLFLWEPAHSKKPVERMTGHQQPVNDVKFSPDTRLIASASFDKSIRLWNGLTGKFICVLRGHISGVYQVAWSADSRLLVSGSKDSTLKVWNMNSKKIEIDLPGHADEVYAVDWSPDGQRVVSGGKDKILKLWRR